DSLRERRLRSENHRNLRGNTESGEKFHFLVPFCARISITPIGTGCLLTLQCQGRQDTWRPPQPSDADGPDIPPIWAHFGRLYPARRSVTRPGSKIFLKGAFGCWSTSASNREPCCGYFSTRPSKLDWFMP